MPNRRNKDTQRNAFQLTINNPADSGLDHRKIKDAHHGILHIAVLLHGG